MKQDEVILHVAAEGGGLTIYGRRVGEGWQFSRDVFDHTPELIDEESIQHTSKVVGSWEAALGLLDKYPWFMLSPTQVHSDFRQAAYDAAVERLSDRRTDSRDQLRKWHHACLGAT